MITLLIYSHLVKGDDGFFYVSGVFDMARYSVSDPLGYISDMVEFVRTMCDSFGHAYAHNVKQSLTRPCYTIELTFRKEK